MIRRACLEDAKRISEIHIFGWRSAYRGIVSDEYLFSKMFVEDRASKYRESKEYEEHELYVIEDELIVKGFMKIGNCRNEDKKNSFELWGIYVEPTMINSGIGTQLIKYCEKIALERGFEENVIWVFEKNDKARRFYEKNRYSKDGKIEYMERFDANEMRYCKKLKDEQRTIAST